MIRKRPTIPGDRRKDTRYAIALPLHYRLNSGRHGVGQSIDISREGVAFSCGEELSEGDVVEMELQWPVLAHGRDPVVLRVHGCILRSSGSGSAASIARRDFHIVETFHDPVAADRDQPIVEAPSDELLDAARSAVEQH